MHGKYNVAQLQDIVSAVNGLQNRTMQLEKTPYWQRFVHIASGPYDLRYIWKNDIYTQDELVCSQCA